MVKKMFFCAIAIILLIYCAMIVDTMSVLTQVRNALKGKIPSSETHGKPIDYYNKVNNHFTDAGIEKIRLFLIRPLTLHNFSRGLIYIFYTVYAFDGDGNMVYGSQNVPATLKIERQNGVWEIIEIIEAP